MPQPKEPDLFKRQSRFSIGGRKPPVLTQKLPPKARRKNPADQLPPATDWRTTDADEILKRRLRAKEDKPRVVNLDPAHPVFSNFAVHSPSDLTYHVELRDLTARQFACTDFRINGLGTCKHVEAVLLHLGRREKEALRAARATGSTRIDLVSDADADTLRVERNLDRLPRSLAPLFTAEGILRPEHAPAALLDRVAARQSGDIRISCEVAPWLEARRRAA